MTLNMNNKTYSASSCENVKKLICEGEATAIPIANNKRYFFGHCNETVKGIFMAIPE
jgi:alpha-tubulin suppressor-like RCC1 family protein